MSAAFAPTLKSCRLLGDPPKSKVVESLNRGEDEKKCDKPVKEEKCCKRESVKFVSKNMYDGIDKYFSALPSSNSNITNDTTYTSFIDRLFEASPDVPVTLDNYAQVFENMWLQVNDEKYAWASRRLDQMAVELAEQHADVIGLQECLMCSNNPILNPDGTIRPGYLRIQTTNSYDGNEKSIEANRVIDYCQMIIDRLKNNHGQEFIIASRILGDQAQGPRSSISYQASVIDFSLTITNVLLVRKSLNVSILRDYSRFNDSDRIVQAGRCLDLQGHQILCRPVIGYRRGYTCTDVEFPTKNNLKIRIINGELASTPLEYNLPTTSTWDPPNTVPASVTPAFSPFSIAQNDAGGGRGGQSVELREREIKPCRFFVVNLWDLNTASPSEQTNQDQFPVNAYQTFVTSGIMADAAVEKYGQVEAAKLKTYGIQVNIGGVDYPIWEALRIPTLKYLFRIDFILYRLGDGITVDTFGLTQTKPMTQTPEHPFAWTSYHTGIYAKLTFPTSFSSSSS